MNFTTTTTTVSAPRLTPEQLRLKDLESYVIGTLDDPDEQWSGASAPYDMYLKARDHATETTCSHCFLIVLKSVVNSGLCPDCQ